MKVNVCQKLVEDISNRGGIDEISKTSGTGFENTKTPPPFAFAHDLDQDRKLHIFN